MRKMFVHNVCVFSVLSCFVCFSNRIWYRVRAYFVYDVLVQRAYVRQSGPRKKKKIHILWRWKQHQFALSISREMDVKIGESRTVVSCTNSPSSSSRAKLKIITFVFIDSIQFNCSARAHEYIEYTFLLVDFFFTLCAPILLVSSPCPDAKPN